MKEKEKRKTNLITKAIVAIVVLIILATILVLAVYKKAESISSDSWHTLIHYIGKDGTIGGIFWGDNEFTDTMCKLINKKGETICTFTGTIFPTTINNELLIVIERDKSFKIINTKGNVLFEDTIISESENDMPRIITNCNGIDKFLAIKKGEKYKIVNVKTMEVLAYYEDIDSSYNSDLFLVKKDGKYGWIDENGNVIINFEYQEVSYDDEDVIVTKKDGKWGCIDNKGNIVINFEYDELGEPSENLISAKRGDKIGFLDKQGNIIIDFKYDYEWDEEETNSENLFSLAMPIFKEEVSLVHKDNRVFFIDEFGNNAIDFETDFTINRNCYENGILIGEKNGKYGAFDKNGKLLVDFIYDEIENDSKSELFKAKLNEKWGYIDYSGKIVIDFEYDFFYFDFESNNSEYAIAIKDGKWGCINKLGDILIDFEYDRIVTTNNRELMLVTKNNKYKLISITGKTSANSIYDDYSLEYESSIRGTEPNFIGAFKRGEYWDVLDIDGNVVGTYKF